MRFSRIRKLTFYAVVTIAIAFSASQLDFPKVRADEGVQCCVYGQDCPRFIICCHPGLGQAPCSQNKPNYCQVIC
jgi:hypothetical protein